MREDRAFLIVDDERDILDSVERLFRKECRVLVAESPEEGLALLEQHEIQVVLSDQRMPTSSGVEFLAHMREEHPDVIRVLLTGYANIDHVIDAINRGQVYRYVSKPWDPEELRVIVRQCFERWEARHERDRLVAELERRNEELQLKNQELKTLDRLKDVFMEVVSHELNTPIAVILGYAFLLRRELSSYDNEIVDKAVRGIESGGTRLKNIANRIFKLLEEDRPATLVTGPIELEPFLEALRDEVDPFLRKRQQRIEISVSGDAAIVEGDEHKVHDILLNLVMNAIKFSPDGLPIVVETASLGADAVKVSVRDEGIGVSDDDRHQVFVPFFSTFESQYHSSGDFEFGKRGIGLGLAVAQRFAKMHGGNVELEHSDATGSTFTLILPRYQPAATRD